ncbi:MAG: nuclear transport factor 2 family protein [Desulfobacteraceae bacterium]|jgi:hypothetical protein
MSDIKSNADNHQKQADAGRRSFMWKIGAGMSAVLAATVPAIAKPVISDDKKLKTSVDSLSKQLTNLENEKSVRQLHKIFEDSIDKGMYGEVLDMFTDNAEVIFNGGVFKGNRGIERLFCDHFRAGMTGKKIDPAPGFELNSDQLQDIVEVSPDQKSANARFTYSIQVGKPIDSDSLIVKMARLQGEGIQKWWEGGVYELSYVKDIRKGAWKIKRLEYRTFSRADYKPGRSTAKEISVPQFTKVYPKDPAGPDRLV